LTADGHYRVRRGDSLYTIAFRLGLDWRDLAKWNGIGVPYTIYPDQELRLSPPPARADSAVVIRPARSPAATISTEQGASAPKEQPGTLPAAAGNATAAPSRPPPSTPAPSPVTTPSTDPGAWLWPAEGRLLSTFKSNDPSRNGIEIGGKEGQAIIAAAAGEVVYSGSGLIGYGELIIIKHSDRMLSAYAHNRKRLVTEGQRVAAGERLAEMGRDDRNQPMLHFEIRVNGTPQDPLKFLPRR
jgi:lipoprotein NlpD